MKSLTSRGGLHPVLGILVVWALLGGNGRPAQAQRPLQAATPPPATTIYLPLVQKPGGGAPTGGPSSAELIAQAVQRGELDAEAALLYRVFAAFADPRLPARFKGYDAAGSDDELARDVEAQLPQLSPQARATLRPFFIAPFHAGSWWDQRRAPAQPGAPALAETRTCDNFADVDLPLFQDWQYLDSPGGHTRIWWQTRYPEDAAKAKAMNATIETIWGHLSALMKREPPGDGGEGRPCRGGSSRLDISLVDFDYNGMVSRFDAENPQPGPASTFMLLNRTRESEAAMRATLIHELMHMFQFAFHISNAWEYIWWMEATATWAVHYVETLEPAWRSNAEHIRALLFLEHPEFPLELRTEGGRHYGAYLLPFFMQVSNNGGPELVRQSFERSEKMGNSLENIDGIIPGGFKAQWPQFTLRNVNRPPVNDYEKADGLTFRASFAASRDVALEGAGDRSYALDGEVGHLASHAFRFRFDGTDVRSMLFVNPFAGGNWPTASVRALVKIGGQWKEEDWTSLYGKVYCRDLMAERVEELVVVIGNSEWKDRSHMLKPAYPPRLNVTNVACRGWRFEGNAHLVVASEGHSVDETTTVAATFLRKREADDDGAGRAFEIYQLSQGQASWTHTGQYVNCGGSGAGYFTPMGDAYAMLLLRAFATNDIATDYAAGDRRYSGYGGEGPAVFLAQYVTYTCSSGRTYEKYLGSVAHWLATEATPTQQISADGKTIKGSFIHTGADDEGATVTTYTWEMTALPPE